MKRSNILMSLIYRVKSADKWPSLVALQTEESVA